MQYSPQTIRKALNGLRTEINFYLSRPYDCLKIHVSKGNKKIGYTHNFSIAPVITCPNCSKCIWKCYDIKAVMQYKNVLKARAENTALIMMDMDRTFAQLDKYVSRKRKHKHFRFHVSGDIPYGETGEKYFLHMVKLARKYPDWRFWTYTKNYTVINRYCDQYGKDSIPENLSIMFSAWDGLPCINPYGFAEFSCVPEGGKEPETLWKCPGKCDICLQAKRGCPYQESSFVNEH